MFLEMTAHKDMQHKVSCGLQASVVQQLDGNLHKRTIQAINNWDRPQYYYCFQFHMLSFHSCWSMQINCFMTKNDFDLIILCDYYFLSKAVPNSYFI